MSMTKSDLVEHLSEKLRIPKGRAEDIVNCIFDTMEKALREGGRIEIRGFGSFEVREYKAYEGRNPRTGAPVEVKPKRLPFFKVGKDLKERINASAGKGAAASGDGKSAAASGDGKGAAASGGGKAEPARAPGTSGTGEKRA
jgi:integration host factor subunit beta